jgi:hypothetical protein
MTKTHRTFYGHLRRVGRAFARSATLVLAVIVIALMYQGERWTLQRPSLANDPSLLASCAIDVVRNSSDAVCTRESVH